MIDAHPLAELIPEMSPEQYDQLVEDIGANGLREPIVIYEGLVLDGRHRLRALHDLVEHGHDVIEPRFIDFEGTAGEAEAFVFSMNLHRRHLEYSQRVALAAEYKRLHPQREGRPSKLAEIGEFPVTRQDAAQKFNVGRTAVNEAEAILEVAPELFEVMKDGGITLRDAQRTVQERETGTAHVSHNSGDNEWYTPKEFTDAATAAMGAIDLDPASSETANQVIGAAKYYTVDDNGLAQLWNGRVWMNPPYAQPLISDFCTRLVRAVSEGSVTQACVLVNNATETSWFQSVASISSAICFPRGRVRFWYPGKTSSSPLQGQAILYIGEHISEFTAEFQTFGLVVTV